MDIAIEGLGNVVDCVPKLVVVTVFFIGILSVHITDRVCENNLASNPTVEVLSSNSEDILSMLSLMAVKPGRLPIVVAKYVVVVIVFLLVFVLVMVSVRLTKLGSLIRSQL